MDGPKLGILRQNGARYFLQRFSLRPHTRYSQAEAMQFAMEHQNPPVAVAVGGDKDSPYPATSFGYLKISVPGVLLWSLKPHDDGIQHGVVARLWNQHDKPVTFDLDVGSATLVAARRLSHIETTLAPLALSDGVLRDEVAAQRMETYGLDVAFPATAMSLSCQRLSKRPLRRPCIRDNRVCPGIGRAKLLLSRKRIAVQARREPRPPENPWV